MTSVPEWDRQFRLVCVHREHREELGGLGLAGIGACSPTPRGATQLDFSITLGIQRRLTDQEAFAAAGTGPDRSRWPPKRRRRAAAPITGHDLPSAKKAHSINPAQSSVHSSLAASYALKGRDRTRGRRTRESAEAEPRRLVYEHCTLGFSDNDADGPRAFRGDLHIATPDDRSQLIKELQIVAPGFMGRSVDIDRCVVHLRRSLFFFDGSRFSGPRRGCLRLHQ